jgi:FixJ family two-component response regulator
MAGDDPIIFVIDDEPSVRKALGRLLSASGLQAETFASAEEFLRRLPYDGPGCIVLDVQMPGQTGLDLQDFLRRSECHLPIVFITGHGDVPTSVRALKAGALDFLQKPFTDSDLLQAIDASLQKDLQARAVRVEVREVERRLATLTPRERQVLVFIVGGSLNKQTAFDLGISEKTVKVHRARVMEKMGAASLADLVRLAAKVGIVGAGPADNTPSA